uniref:Uncharacterized protein n=1 Tax=Strongyloides stercoralis TaxID=6248 RepID=A0A0K0DZI7_STRER
MQKFIFTNILIFLIVPNIFINCLVLYHRIPKPRLICHEEVTDNSTLSKMNRNRNNNKPQMPIIPEESDDSTVLHVEHVRLRREIEDGPFLQIDNKYRVSLNTFEIINDKLNNAEKEEIRKKIVNMCQTFNVNSPP